MSDMADFSPNSTRGPDARKRGVARTAREMIEQLCTVKSPMFAHLPEMYSVAECVDGHTNDGRLCEPSALHKLSTAGGHKRRWFVLRAADGPFEEEITINAAGAQAAYAAVCGSELLPAEPEITEAITALFHVHKKDFNKLAKASENLNVTVQLDKARQDASDAIGLCMPTKPEDPVPDDCEAQLEDAHDELVKINATRNKVEAKCKYAGNPNRSLMSEGVSDRLHVVADKKAMQKMATVVVDGKAVVGGEACVEVCHEGSKKTKGKLKGKKTKVPGTSPKKQKQVTYTLNPHRQLISGGRF